VELARQFGFATGAGQALRSALDKPEKTLYQRVTEAHDRGAILVAAVFDCFFTTYQRRIRDLIRIATGGSGIIPVGDLHPDLINLAANEAGRTAQGILTMAIRAFEYLPPVDITFGDYLRALVTADYELVPDDEIGQRAAMIEAFRLRGIYPQNVISLAEESLLWPAAEDMPALPDNLVSQVMAEDARPFGRRRYTQPSGSAARADETMGELDEEKFMAPGIAAALREYATTNALRLKLDPKRKIHVQGFHSVFRVAPDGQLLIELVAQFTQEDRSQLDDFGGLPLRGGTTVVAAADGSIRYVIAKPLPARQLSAEDNAYAEARIERQREYITLCDAQDPKLAWSDPDEYMPTRMAARMNFAGLHAGMIG
ncbi:MAG TPA: hypothetical protein VK864_02690, partial [Longimicrobiales bacterium]|nr:hypothetical protein [Longimicrobiales bacterium]